MTHIQKKESHITTRIKVLLTVLSSNLALLPSELNDKELLILFEKLFARVLAIDKVLGDEGTDGSLFISLLRS